MPQGRNWLSNTGWASSNAACRRWPTAPSILPKTGWAIAHPVQGLPTPSYAPLPVSMGEAVNSSIIEERMTFTTLLETQWNFKCPRFI